MVGGTIFHRDVIQREISRALVLNLSGKTRCSGTAEEIFVLDNAFALIEGQPACVCGKQPTAMVAAESDEMTLPTVVKTH